MRIRFQSNLKQNIGQIFSAFAIPESPPCPTFQYVVTPSVPTLWKGAVVIWDNYSIHKGKEIEKAIIKAGAKLIYLPPYSPDFNQARKLLVKN